MATKQKTPLWLSVQQPHSSCKPCTPTGRGHFPFLLQHLAGSRPAVDTQMDWPVGTKVLIPSSCEPVTCLSSWVSSLGVKARSFLHEISEQILWSVRTHWCGQASCLSIQILLHSCCLSPGEPTPEMPSISPRLPPLHLALKVMPGLMEPPGLCSSSMAGILSGQYIAVSLLNVRVMDQPDTDNGDAADVWEVLPVT